MILSTEEFSENLGLLDPDSTLTSEPDLVDIFSEAAFCIVFICSSGELGSLNEFERRCF